MVKSLTQQERDALQAAIARAEQATSTTIRAVIVPASDPYRDFLLVLGLMKGSLIALLLWAFDIIHGYPLLLAVQLAAMMAYGKIPFLRHCAVFFVPRAMGHKRAARLAFEEYHAHHQNIAKDRAFVLLFVSLAERYVHVVTNPTVHTKIPTGWDTVTTHFTGEIRQSGLAAASLKAVEEIEALLVN